MSVLRSMVLLSVVLSVAACAAPDPTKSYPGQKSSGHGGPNHPGTIARGLVSPSP